MDLKKRDLSFPGADALGKVQLPLPVEPQHVLKDAGRAVKEELPGGQTEVKLQLKGWGLCMVMDLTKGFVTTAICG